jgi:hypothetical protein
MRGCHPAVENAKDALIPTALWLRSINSEHIANFFAARLTKWISQGRPY